MPPNPLATPACLGWPFGLATALNDELKAERQITFGYRTTGSLSKKTKVTATKTLLQK